MSPDSFKKQSKTHLFNVSFLLIIIFFACFCTFYCPNIYFSYTRLEHSTEWIWHFINHMNYYYYYYFALNIAEILALEYRSVYFA